MNKPLQRMHHDHDRRLRRILPALLLLGMALLGFANTTSRAATAPAVDVAHREYLEYLRKTKGIVDIRLVHDSGSGKRSFNLMVVSAGWGAKDIDAFYAMCETLQHTLFNEGAWKRYQGMVNIYGILVDDESLDKTRVGVGGYKGQILGCDNKTAIELANYAGKSDATVVIHNSTFATATCGPWAMVTGNRDTAGSQMTLLHELGHSVGGVGDTYVQRPGPYDGSIGSTWEGKNGSSESNPLLTHWHYWTQDVWPGMFGPLKLPEGSKVGNYEGGAWATKFYRPEMGCAMHGDGTRIYCTVCNEVMETCFFRTINMFEKVSPAAGDVVMWKGQSLPFSLKAIKFIREQRPWFESQLDFYVDGKYVAKSRAGEVGFQFGGKMATPGIHQIGANLSVQPERVRRDDGFLTSSRAWRVKVMAYEKPRLVMQPGVTVEQGTAVKVPVRVEHSRKDLVEVRMTHAPDGATLQGGAFEWRTTKPGAWRVDFTVSVAQQEALTESLVIEIKRKGAANAETLTLKPLAPVEALVGKETTIQIAAEGNQGSQLLYQILNAPDGMKLDRGTGKAVWTPSIEQVGPQRLHIRVSDGTTSKDQYLLVGVCMEPVPYQNSYMTSYPKDRQQWLKESKDIPFIYERIFGLTRMFRERFSIIYSPAVEEAKGFYNELSPELRETFMQELARHAWEFVDRPKIIEWATQISSNSNTPAGRWLKARLQDISLWAKVKQTELAGDPKQLRSLLGVLPKTNEEAVHSAIRRAVKTLYGKTDNKSAFQNEIRLVLQKKGRDSAALIPLLPDIEMQDCLIDAARDANEDVSRNALATLSKTGTAGEIAPLSKLLVLSGDSKRRAGILGAMRAIGGRITDKIKFQEPMLAVVADTTGPGRQELLETLPLIKDSKLTEVLARLSKENDTKLAGAARKAQKYLSDEIGATDAFVASWNLSGPYLLDGKATVFAPETGAKAEWKPYDNRSAAGPRIVPLKDIFGGDSRVAYMRAVVRSEVAQPVMFGAGSDDGITVWLNGKQIHNVTANRAVKPDEDQFAGTLKAGENIILCKITQSVLGWAACLTVRAPDGGPALGVTVVPVSEQRAITGK